MRARNGRKRGGVGAEPPHSGPQWGSAAEEPEPRRRRDHQARRARSACERETGASEGAWGRSPHIAARSAAPPPRSLSPAGGGTIKLAEQAPLASAKRAPARGRGGGAPT